MAMPQLLCALLFRKKHFTHPHINAFGGIIPLPHGHGNVLIWYLPSGLRGEAVRGL